jgi:hypothetical protein
MKKINNKSINYGLKILTILAFGLIFVPFNKVSAEIPGYVTPYNSTTYTYPVNNNSYYNSYNTPTSPQVVYVPAPAPKTVSAPQTVVYKTTPPASTVATPATETTPSDNSNNTSNLASTAIFGSNSFLPSGLVQWILFGIIILLLVIFVRKIFGARENYDELPMKHA